MKFLKCKDSKTILLIRRDGPTLPIPLPFRIRQPYEDIVRLRQIAEVLLHNGLSFHCALCFCLTHLS